MFDKQYRFVGKHAKMVDELTKIFIKEKSVKIFAQNYGIYINAPIIGFLYNRRSMKDTTSEDKNYTEQSIFPEQVIKNADTLTLIFKMIILLDSENNLNPEEKIEIAFNTTAKPDAEKLLENELKTFDSYLLGGVEILYEKFIPVTKDSYPFAVIEFLKEIEDRFNSGITEDEIFDLANSNNRISIN